MKSKHTHYHCSLLPFIKWPVWLVALLLISFASVTSAAPGDLSDSNIKYVGRWDFSNPSQYAAHWGGAYIKVNFTGTTAKIKVGSTANYFAKIDNGSWVSYTNVSGTINLTPTPLANGTHTLSVAEGRDYVYDFLFQGLIFDTGATTAAPTVSPNLIEFIGDSITTGYTCAQANVSDYAWVVSEALNAEHTQIAFPGIALTTGFGINSDKTGMDTQYFRASPPTSTAAWDFTKYTPKLVVFNIGQNDPGTESDSQFQSTFTTFLSNVRAKFPNAEMFVMRIISGNKVTPELAAVNARISAGDTKLHYIDTTGWLVDGSSDYDDAVHPSVTGHIKIANHLQPILAPYLSVALNRSGWVASASSTQSGGSPANALDGNISTRWSTGAAQTNGQWFQVNMGSAQTFSQIVLDAGGSTGDYPRGYQVNVSSDGINWGSPVATGSSSSAVTTITFAAQTARYLRITQTGTSSTWWSIAEFNVYRSGSAKKLVPGTIVSLKAMANGNYVYAANATTALIANQTSVGTAEEFKVVDAANGNIGLQALVNNEYVCADNGGTSPLIANRTSVGPWETYTEIDAADGTIGLRAMANGEYVSADNGGASPLIANRTAIGPWESFTVGVIAGGGVIFYQDTQYGGSVGQPLAKGTYTSAQLAAANVPGKWASSVQIPAGWTVIMYANDNFAGQSWTLTANTPDFTTLSPNANDQMSSCKVQ